MKKILFVCTGNICRSPVADAVMRHHLRQAGLWQPGLVDSAGTHDYHRGHAPDPRSIASARQRGYDLSPLRARRVTAEDFGVFDEILAMDRGHLAFLQRLCPPADTPQARVGLFLDYLPGHHGQDVPDPYYGTSADFEIVLDLIVPTIMILVDKVKTGLTP